MGLDVYDQTAVEGVQLVSRLDESLARAKSVAAKIAVLLGLGREMDARTSGLHG